MSLRSMLPYWKYWVARLHPDVVLIYPSPAFYLGSTAMREIAAPVATVTPTAPVPSNRFESRFFGRIRSILSAAVPRRVNMYRNQRQVRAKLADLPPMAEITSPPRTDLAAFEHDLDDLVMAIQLSGAHVVLLTHAQRAGLPIESRNLPDLWAARIWSPTAALSVLIEFDRAANVIIGETAQRRKTQLVDSAAVLNGQFDSFGDLIHFSDRGAEIMANIIEPRIQFPAP
jgi:hypothetical protein